MPELPEVETVVRGLRPPLEGKRLLEVEQHCKSLRFPLPEDFPRRLTGRRVERIRRRAKYILLELDSREVLLCHLGMSGRMTVEQACGRARDRHDHVVFRTTEGLEIRFNDQRRFGVMDLIPAEHLSAHRLLKALGPEPLGNEFNGPVLAQALDGRRTTIKAALLDQRVVAGLGNIYASEALFHAGLSPRRRAGTVRRLRAERLAKAIRDVLERAIAAGGSSLRDYIRADGELGYFQHSWAVYGREGDPCPGCDCDPAQTGGIARLVQSGRSTFFCARRQS